MNGLQNTQFNHEIQIDKVACPLHVLQMKKELGAIDSGETLKVNSTAYVALELLAAARQLGRDVSINEYNEIYIIKA